MADFKLQVFTQESKVLDEDVTSITVPAESGYLGVLAHHAPLVATIGRGKLTVRQGAAERNWQVAGGFLEVHDNVATLLLDEFQPAP